MDPTEQLLRYQIMEPLGSGGQGRTFRAIDRQNGHEVAIKVLALNKLGDWKPFDLFEREIAVLRSLDHPSIPQYIDNYASEETGDYFLVMELAPGASLRDRLARGQPLAAEQITRVLDRMLDVLEHLHDRAPPVIHRDIKPANIVLGPQGQMSLVDFGGVRVALRAGGGSTMIGTFGYMAPEQLHGDATPATDIYALGATIATLCTGLDADKLPHDGLRIDLASVMPPSRLRDTLTRMLEPDPRGRLASAAEVRRALADEYAEPDAGAGDVAGDHSSGDDDSPGSGDEPTKMANHASSADRDRAAIAFDVTSEVRELAKVPRPFSIPIWLWSVAMSGALFIVELVILPIVYQLMRRSAAHGRGGRARRRFVRDQQHYRQLVSSHRQALEYVADRTSPRRGGRRRQLRAARRGHDKR